MEKEIKINVPDGYELDKENSTFECIKFKPIVNKLPKTWEEYCETHSRRKGEAWYDEEDAQIQIVDDTSCCINSRRSATCDVNLFPNRKYVEAMLALCKLIQLRDCYNNGWVPDWTNCENKYVIYIVSNIIVTNTQCYTKYVLNFKSAKLCIEFLNNFRDLIEIAKPLL